MNFVFYFFDHRSNSFRELNNFFFNEQKTSEYYQYPKYYREWREFVQENTDQYRDLCLNGFSNQENALDDSIECGYASGTYEVLIHQIRYEISKRMKLNKKRIQNNIKVSGIESRYFDSFFGEEGRKRYSRKFGDEVIIMYEWNGKNYLPELDTNSDWK